MKNAITKRLKKHQSTTEGLAAADEILSRLERRRERLAEQLRPLLSEYRVVQGALAALRQVRSAEECQGGPICRVDANHVLELSSRDAAAASEAARQLVGPELARYRAARTAGSPTGHVLRPGSLPAHARDVLRAAGAPLHADVILERLALGGIAAKRDSLVTVLARLAGRGFVFYRVAEEANTFGLREWLPSNPNPSRPQRRPRAGG